MVGSLTGFGAAKHLAEQGYAVTLLDGSANPGGLSAGWRTPQGRAVEAGVKGFWYQVRVPQLLVMGALSGGFFLTLFSSYHPDLIWRCGGRICFGHVSPCSAVNARQSLRS